MLKIEVIDSGGVGEARRRTSQLAKEHAFPDIEVANLAIIVTEAASNLIKHTKSGGTIIIAPFQLDEQYNAINIWALDKGKGMANCAQSMQDGYSTAGTSGTGLGAIKRLASAFDVYSQPNQGTILWAQIIIHLPSNKKIPKYLSLCQNMPLDIGAISIPIKGEQVCGDGYAVGHNDSANKPFMVVDGLGHGDGAFEAADEAIKIFKNNQTLNLPDLLQKMHLGLHKTRGAAITLGQITPKELEYVGIGNVTGVLITNQYRKSFVILNGIVGHNIRKVQTFKLPLPQSFTLIIHSDGIITRWDLDDYPGILERPANIIAGIFYRDYERGRDDTTVLVIKRP